MQVKTILNRIQKYKSFVYGAVRFINTADEPHIEVDMWHRANSKPVCSGCGGRRPGYDRLAVGRFEFVPLWNIQFCLGVKALYDTAGNLSFCTKPVQQERAMFSQHPGDHENIRGVDYYY